MSAPIPDAGKFIDYVWALREERDQLTADNKRMREALRMARLFIRNGIDLGYIKMPDGEFCGYFHAISDEHAAAMLSEMKETAELKGRMVEAKP